MFELPVNEVRFYTPDIFELSLEKGGYSFRPGQCAVLFNDVADSRPYSLASGAGEPLLRFLIRRISDGAVSRWLGERKPGDMVQVSAPFGDFCPDSGRSTTVFVATGVGIAPFLSVLRSSPNDPLHEKLLCLYGVRYRRDAVELALLSRLADLKLAVSREMVLSHFQGHVTALLRTPDLPLNADFFLCGYDAMIDEAFGCLNARGVALNQIHSEVFFTSARSRLT
ncbi:ferredoxin--NADP reductase [Tichowtungia aerotolerans]|uniref:FAD-binding FR-type domain-containing protein n=1 Tax=Tichowtungia aerotolerans TaxID=2697043 RepID=A0A6P1M3N2_9BACT|nr:FAD-binding oxidoreductase [Tichowtungia aerotolerans]QHI68431.1 hypothetical protein GT409_02825 [Tichowtungia aerotolerans]